MIKLTGKGRPTPNTKGELGQFYQDTTTGDIYECRVSSEFSKLHGAPVGGYQWELRASGEDRKEHSLIYGGIKIIPTMDMGDNKLWVIGVTAKDIEDTLDECIYAFSRFVVVNSIPSTYYSYGFDIIDDHKYRFRFPEGIQNIIVDAAANTITLEA